MTNAPIDMRVSSRRAFFRRAYRLSPLQEAREEVLQSFGIRPQASQDGRSRRIHVREYFEETARCEVGGSLRGDDPKVVAPGRGWPVCRGQHANSFGLETLQVGASVSLKLQSIASRPLTQERVQRPAGDHATVVENQDRVADPLDVLEKMRREQD